MNTRSRFAAAILLPGLAFVNHATWAAEFDCALAFSRPMPRFAEVLVLRVLAENVPAATCAARGFVEDRFRDPGCGKPDFERAIACVPALSDAVIDPLRQGGREDATGTRRSYHCRLNRFPAPMREQRFEPVEAARWADVVAAAPAGKAPQRGACIRTETYLELTKALGK